MTCARAAPGPSSIAQALAEPAIIIPSYRRMFPPRVAPSSQFDAASSLNFPAEWRGRSTARKKGREVPILPPALDFENFVAGPHYLQPLLRTS